MLDFRIETFLELCRSMNYTRAAEHLGVTQPAVTQHIRWLEDYYGCKLFCYEGRTLSLTPRGERLRDLALSMAYNSEKIRRTMRADDKSGAPMRVGATKTIGEFVIGGMVSRYLAKHPERHFCLVVDNTRVLLGMIERGELDFAIVEGFFDKSKYGFGLFRSEDFIGVCGRDHPLADRPLEIEDILNERLILREAGSGTRAIFETLLREHNYSFESIPNITEISDFSVIKRLIADGVGISFLYRPVVQRELESGEIKKLRLAKMEAQREFNYVFLKENMFLSEWRDFFGECAQTSLKNSIIETSMPPRQ